ncbi:MAG: hypothetical protein ABJD97_09555, partial [Betaproteobacteria bacterium]
CCVVMMRAQRFPSSSERPMIGRSVFTGSGSDNPVGNATWNGDRLSGFLVGARMVMVRVIDC